MTWELHPWNCLNRLLEWHSTPHASVGGDISQGPTISGCWGRETPSSSGMSSLIGYAVPDIQPRQLGTPWNLHIAKQWVVEQYCSLPKFQVERIYCSWLHSRMACISLYGNLSAPQLLGESVSGRLLCPKGSQNAGAFEVTLQANLAPVNKVCPVPKLCGTGNGLPKECLPQW